VVTHFVCDLSNLIVVIQGGDEPLTSLGWSGLPVCKVPCSHCNLAKSGWIDVPNTGSLSDTCQLHWITALMFLDAYFMVCKDSVKVRLRKPSFLELVATPGTDI